VKYNPNNSNVVAIIKMQIFDCLCFVLVIIQLKKNSIRFCFLPIVIFCFRLILLNDLRTIPTKRTIYVWLLSISCYSFSPLVCWPTIKKKRNYFMLNKTGFARLYVCVFIWSEFVSFSVFGLKKNKSCVVNKIKYIFIRSRQKLARDLFTITIRFHFFASIK
jgi:hypothetical protein